MQSNEGGIAERVKQLRQSFGYKTSKLARELGISHQAIRKLEDGTVKCPKANVLYKLAKKLKTTPEYILEGKGFSKVYENVGNKIPILNPNEVLEWCQSDIKSLVSHQKDYINNPLSSMEKDIFAYKIQTDSMDAIHELGIPIGAIAICKPSKSVVPNKCELFYDRHEDGVFIREIIFDGKTYLKPLNPQFSLIELTDDIQPIAEILAFVKLL